MIINKEEMSIIYSLRPDMSHNLDIIPNDTLKYTIIQRFKEVGKLYDASVFNPEFVNIFNNSDYFMETVYQLRRIVKERVSSDYKLTKLDVFYLLYNTFGDNPCMFTKHYSDSMLWAMMLNDWLLKEVFEDEPIGDAK